MEYHDKIYDTPIDMMKGKIFAAAIMALPSFYAACTTGNGKPSADGRLDTTMHAAVQAGNKPVADTVSESRIFDTLMKVPRVAERNRYLDSLTHHQKHVAMIVLQTPVRDSAYYIVQLGYNGEMRFEPYFNFIIYTTKFEIKYLDPLTEDSISLSEWNRRKM